MVEGYLRNDDYFKNGSNIPKSFGLATFQLMRHKMDIDSRTLTFRFILPYKVPIADGESLIQWDDDSGDIIMYYFEHREYKDVVFNDVPLSRPILISVVELSINVPNGQDVDDVGALISEFYVKCMTAINRYMNVITMRDNNYKVRPIRQFDLLGVVVYSLFDHTDTGYREILSGVLDEVEEDRRFTDNNTLEYDMRSFATLGHKAANLEDSIYYNSFDMLVQGNRMIVDDKADMAIVIGQIGFEMFIKRLVEQYYKLIMPTISESKIDKILRNVDKKDTFNKYVKNGIFENMNIRNRELINQELDFYFLELKGWRNNIIHHGFKYTFGDAIVFMDHMYRLIYMIILSFEHRLDCGFTMQLKEDFRLMFNESEADSILRDYKINYDSIG